MTTEAPLDVLAIAAHPDDVELSVGGTLIKLGGLGYRTGILDLTRGEAGTRGTPELRAGEARRAGELLAQANALVRTMADKAPVALRYAKEAVVKGLELPGYDPRRLPTTSKNLN